MGRNARTACAALSRTAVLCAVRVEEPPVLEMIARRFAWMLSSLTGFLSRSSVWTMLVDELPEPSETDRVGSGRRHGVREREHPEQPSAHDVGATSLADGGEDLARDHVGLAEGDAHLA